MKIGNFLTSVIRKAQNITSTSPRKIKTRTPISDVFEKQETPIFPPKIQQFLDKFGRYQQNEKNFWENLYKLSPEKYEIMNTCEQFSYVLEGTSKQLFEAIDKLSPKELKTTLDEITKLYEELPKELIVEDIEKELYRYETRIPSACDIANFTILKAYQEETFNYLLNHPNKEIIVDLLRDINYNMIQGTTFKTLTPAQIRQMTLEGVEISKDRKPSTGVHEYVGRSDSFLGYPEKVKNLHEYLSKFKTLEDFTAFRGEKDPGMFDCIPINKSLAMKTRFYILKNFITAQKTTVTPYTGHYDKYFDKKMSMLKYILTKKELSLADAMQVAKYGNSKFRTEIINLIKNSKIKDNRFKSLTFDKGMASRWINSLRTGHTTILQNITVKKGKQGRYSDVHNDQVEFVLNNNDKVFTFQDVKYDSDKDIFIFESTIS